MEEIYDRNFASKEKQSVAEKAWKEYKKTKVCKDVISLLSNPVIKWASISTTVFKWTPAEFKNEYYNQSVHVWWVESFENEFMSRVRTNTKSTYPDEYTVRSKLRSTLAIKLIWGKDLEKALAEVSSSIKKQFKI